MGKVIIPDTAKESYRILLEGVYHYSTNAALKLEEKLDFYIAQLGLHQLFCPSLSKFPNLRRCRLTKYICMVYRVLY